MTTCIAAMQRDAEGDCIVVCSDTRVSLLGDWFSQEGVRKFHCISDEWLMMFAGDLEDAKKMLDAMRQTIPRSGRLRYENVVDHVRKAYARVRERLIETKILPDFGIGTFAEFAALPTSDNLCRTISQQIKAEQENWCLLVCGFDDKREPRMFVISEAGRVEYYDGMGRAAIGSGAAAALLWLGHSGFRVRGNMGAMIFRILSAKFFAEKSSDVGKRTILGIFRPGKTYILALPDSDIKKARRVWEALPVSRPGIEKQLEHYIRIHLALYDPGRDKSGS